MTALPLVTDWVEAWTALHKATGLDEDQFADFLRAFEFTSLALDQPELIEPRDSEDLFHLASVLQSIVVDPGRPVELTRSEFLKRLGWEDRVKYRNPHRFPVPDSYTANFAARSSLEAALARHQTGYVALIGPAGSGKSTLVESLSVSGRLIKYYAFVPDSPDPFSGRGEAQSFLHDLSLALEEGGLHRTGFGNDLLGQREVLFDQLARAGDRYTTDGTRTTIVIDGLDHIPREQNPSRSLLDELPPPAALPDGVCVVIGSQTTSILPLSIREALSGEDRTVDVPPLSDTEVETIASLAGLASWLSSDQLTELVAKSEGHPLVLTYTIEDLRALESVESIEVRRSQANQMLAAAADFSGSIDSRYEHYLGSLLDDPDVFHILSSVCRLRIPVDVAWLESWASHAAVSSFVERTHTFFRRSGQEWTFIHNSFRRFLVERTATVGSEFRDSRSRELHMHLADRCAASAGWTQYLEEELPQRYLAGQHDRVIQAAEPATLREKLFSGRPHASIRDQTLVAIRSAAEAKDYRALLRLLMFLNELRQREFVLPPADLAAAMVDIRAGGAVEHAIQGRSLRLDPAPALEVALELAASNAIDEADAVVRAAGGLSGLIASRDHDTWKWVESIANWAEVTWHRAGTRRVLDELDHLLPVADLRAPVTPRADASDADSGRQQDREAREDRARVSAIAAARNAVHARCFDLEDSLRDELMKAEIAARIDNESTLDWRVRKHVISARSARSDGNNAQVLRYAQEFLQLEHSWAGGPAQDDQMVQDDEEEGSSGTRAALSLRVAMAGELARSGLAGVDEVRQLLPPDTVVAWPSSVASEAGLSPYLTMLGVLRMRSLARRVPIYDTLPTHGLGVGGADDGPARRRFTAAVAAVADMEAQAILSTIDGAGGPDVPALSEPVVRMLEVHHRSARKWTSWYLFVDAAPELNQRVIQLAFRCGGSRQLERLLAKYKSAWDDPDRTHYWSPKLRIAVIQTAARFPGTNEWCAAALAATEALITHTADPYGSAAAWLGIARTRSILDDSAGAAAAVSNAHRYGWGAAHHHDDDQLVSWLKWLAAATAGDESQYTFTDEVRGYAVRLVAASEGAEGQAAEAAGDLVKTTFPIDPGLAIDLGEALCRSGVLTETQLTTAFASAAAASSNVDHELAAALLTDLLMPLSPDRPESIEKLVVSRTSITDRTLRRLADANAIWTGPGPGDSDTDATTATVQRLSEDSAPLALPTVLGQMRSITDREPSQDDVESWVRAANEFDAVAPRQVAVSLLQETERLELQAEVVATFAGLAAASGATDIATESLSRLLGRTKTYGWIRHFDGGSRATVFEAAGRHGAEAITDLAARDLAGLVASGAIGGDFYPTDLKRIARILGGNGLIRDSWADVLKYLDVFAPAGDEGTMPAVRPSRAPSDELLYWAGLQLGHPIRIMDFGVRRLLAGSHRKHSSTTEDVLMDAMSRHEWAAEAALHTLLVLHQRGDFDPGEHLVTALMQCASADDAVVRELARRLLDRADLPVPLPKDRELPVVYDLTLPPLPPRVTPEWDRHGVPFIDFSDPQQVTGPYDQHIRVFAGEAGLDFSTVLHRAATLGQAGDDPWTEGDQHAHADRLRTRGNLHTYRPWAFMVGRRGSARVLAELIDANALPPGAGSFFADLMIDEAAGSLKPLPLNEFTPSPWRDEGSTDYASEDWCREASGAATFYAKMLHPDHLLAERSHWRWHAWGQPEEKRWVCARHPGQPRLPPLTSHVRDPWETTMLPSSRYPHLSDLDWSNQDLIVQGGGLYSDAERLDWIALHPAVAKLCRWTPGERRFEWLGDDGAWRARTELRVRGQLSHQPPSDAVSAEVWQVVLSDQGWRELRSAFPLLTRRVIVERVLPENRSEERGRQSRYGVAADRVQ